MFPDNPARNPSDELRSTKSAPGGFVPEGEGEQGCCKLYVNSRAVAADVLERVLVERRSLTEALAAFLPSLSAASDKAFVQALCYGVMRALPRLEFLLSQLAHRPIRDPRVRILALLGLHQLACMAVKPHAAVSETVAAGEAWAKPLLNAVLRAWQRQREALDALADVDPQAASAHPRWLIERFQTDWPEQAKALLEANNRQPPMTLRVNRLRANRADYLARLAEAGIAAQPHPFFPCALTLRQPCDVAALPGFGEGLVSVQDAAAQWAAGLLDPRPGQRVLDACAAPGGKAAHLLETCPEIELTALDVDAARAEKIASTFQRLGLRGAVVTADAAAPQSWWDGRPFQRILLDVPCSGTGVIRRHPDIKFLRRPEDIAQLAASQRRLLETLWPLLVPDGVLLYATCSVLREENTAQIGAFLRDHADAAEWPISDGPGIPDSHGRQILTGSEDMDGFYYARLRKKGGVL
jgi:16S rRNA (cytosine967-C5)-methyltransferase